jgi:hypothetical protein
MMARAGKANPPTPGEAESPTPGEAKSPTPGGTKPPTPGELGERNRLRKAGLLYIRQMVTRVRQYAHARV